jgi:dTDP-L-rhamnose 4-epimerase
VTDFTSVSGSKILITGGAGFIGTHTALALLEKGYSVRALDALVPPVHPTPARPGHLPADVELIVGDVRDAEVLTRAMSGVDAVIHLAAYQGYGPGFSNFFAINTVSTALIYEIAVARKMPLRKVVVASSQAVYGEAAYTCTRHGRLLPPLRGDDQLSRGEWEIGCPECGGHLEVSEATEADLAPTNSYAVSKRTQEEVALMLGRRYGIPTTAYRYSIVQGPWQSFSNAYSGICRTFVLRMLAGKAPVAYEDGQQLRDYVWAGDVAAANVLALEDERTDFEVFNVAGAHNCTVLEFADQVGQVLERPRLRPQTPGLYRFGDTRHVVSSPAKLSALGWRQTLTIPEIIERYAEWAGSQPNAQDHFDAALAKMEANGTVRRVQP